MISGTRPSNPFHPNERHRRAARATTIIAIVLGIVAAAFFRTQVLRAEDFRMRAQNNRMRAIPLDAARGIVYDRDGDIIAETVAAYALYLEPTTPDSARAALGRLDPTIPLSADRIEEILAEMERQPHQPTLVATGLSFPQAAWAEEHRLELPGIRLRTEPRRRYPAGHAIAHLIGYVGEISEDELDGGFFANAETGETVGKSGIERAYDGILRGRRGKRFIEVDARGRVVREMLPTEQEDPVPGGDLHLSIDLDLQRFAGEIFPADKAGAIVALSPSTGEVLALYSHPTFDPNLLIGGVDPAVWRDLNGDPRRPLVNRAAAGLYPPGSTWKLATAIIGLEQNVITPETRMPVTCNGGMSYAGRYSRCWKPTGHGRVDLPGAIATSCNVYFYQLGIGLGLAQLTREGTRLGFSRPTGVDIPAERAGIFPTSPAWYRDRFGNDPTPSEVMSLSIGQGPNSQTPLRMAQFFAALAGDGTAPPPRLLAGAADSLGAETDLRLRESTLRAVRDGLSRVTEEGGTAYLASLQRWKLAGKTGTSENAQDPSRPHAWFTGFAGPRGAPPEIAVAVIVEFGRQGSAVAAPIGAKIADYYLNRKYGFETRVDRQTLAERLGIRQ